jgi:hypothetical protein
MHDDERCAQIGRDNGDELYVWEYLGPKPRLVRSFCKQSISGRVPDNGAAACDQGRLLLLIIAEFKLPTLQNLFCTN